MIAPHLPLRKFRLFEYYNTGDNSYADIYSKETWKAQTFTPVVSHSIDYVKLLLYRYNLPSTVTVSIFSTHTITGGPVTYGKSPLCSGTTNGNTLPTGSPYEWRQIDFTTQPVLIAGVKYAIVVKGSGGFLDRVRWRNADPGVYTRGSEWGTSDSGQNWTEVPDADQMFEEWGWGP